MSRSTRMDAKQNAFWQNLIARRESLRHVRGRPADDEPADESEHEASRGDQRTDQPKGRDQESGPDAGYFQDPAPHVGRHQAVQLRDDESEAEKKHHSERERRP